jgi:hypothetical protein
MEGDLPIDALAAACASNNLGVINAVMQVTGVDMIPRCAMLSRNRTIIELAYDLPVTSWDDVLGYAAATGYLDVFKHFYNRYTDESNEEVDRHWCIIHAVKSGNVEMAKLVQHLLPVHEGYQLYVLAQAMSNDDIPMMEYVHQILEANAGADAPFLISKVSSLATLGWLMNKYKMNLHRTHVTAMIQRGIVADDADLVAYLADKLQSLGISIDCSNISGVSRHPEAAQELVDRCQT